MNSRVIEAFEEIRDGWSVDRVVVDPELDRRFLDGCRRRGLTSPDVELNLILFNLRKRGGQLQKTIRQTIMRDQEAYAFASEIAIRCLERKHQTSLDRVLCNPSLRDEFDAVAGAMAPGYSPLQYRWAALSLRKTSKLKPEIAGRVVPARVYGPVGLAQLDPGTLPKQQGLYILTTRRKVLYVGEAKNLHIRMKKHLDHSDNRFLARYIWEFGNDDLFIEYHILPPDTRTRVRKALELELIRSRRAEFNVQR